MKFHIIQITLVFLFMILFSKISIAQDSLVLNKLAELSKKIDSFAKKKDDVQPIAVLSFNAEPIPHFFDGKFANKKKPVLVRAVDNLTIDRVTMLLKDGSIVDINVYSKGKHFSNLKAPIVLSHKRFQVYKDNLYNVDQSDESIFFQDVLHVDSLTSYIPEDGFYELTPSINKISLYKQVGVNTVIDLRLYTDALGVFGNDPNGIIQTDARIKQFLPRRNFTNHGLFHLQFINVNFNASKFTNKNSYVDSTNISRTSLLQKSFINAECSLNLLDQWLEFKSQSSWYWNVGVAINEATIAKSKDTSTVLLSGWFSELGLEIKSSDNSGFNLYFRMLQTFSPQTNWDKNENGRINFKIGGELFWNPFNDQANRLFSRLNYTFASKQDDKENNFFQLQFGYSVLLSSIIKK